MNIKKMKLVPKGAVMRMNTECGAHGECVSVTNMRECGDALMGVGAWREVGGLLSGERLLAVDRRAEGDYFVVARGGEVNILGKRVNGVFEENRKPVLSVDGEVMWAESIGEMLVVGTSVGLRYLRCYDGDYTLLDVADAMPGLVFGTVNVADVSEQVLAVNLEGAYDDWVRLTAKDRASLQDAVSDARNALMDGVKRKGGYVQPVAVRYAVRMWNDEYAWISAPVIVGNGVQLGENTTCEVNGDVCAESVLEARMYNVGVGVVKSPSRDWLPLIKAIDVMVSAEMLPFDGNKVDSRCEEKASKRCVNYKLAQVDHLVRTSQMVNPEKWQVLTSITDLNALCNGEVNVANGVSVIDGSLTALGKAATALVRTDFFTKELSRAKVAELAFVSGQELVANAPASVGGRLYMGGNRYVKRNMWQSVQYWGDDVVKKPCEVIVSAYFHDGDRECVNVEREYHEYTPKSVNAMVAYPDKRAERIEVKVLSDGLVSEWSGHTIRCEEQECACAVSEDFGKQNLEDGVTFYMPTEVRCDICRSNELVVTSIGNPWTYTQRRLVGQGEVMALRAVKKPLYSTVFGRYPVYAFTSEGVYAVSYKVVNDYTDAQLVGNVILANRNAIATAERDVWMVDTKGVLHLLSGKDLQAVEQVGDVAWMCWSRTSQELVVSTADHIVRVRMNSGRWYDLTDAARSAYDDECDAFVVSMNNGLLDVNDLLMQECEMAFDTYPVEVEKGDMVAPMKVIVNVSGVLRDEAKIELLGSDGVDCEWRVLKDVRLQGDINVPIEAIVSAYPCRLMKVRLSGAYSHHLIVRNVTVVYNS